MHELHLIPIDLTDPRIAQLWPDPDCKAILDLMPGFYQKVGFSPPWIGYFIERDGIITGSCAFKGQPVKGTVEIAYATFRQFERQGIASEACRKLIELALTTNAGVMVTACTLAEHNASTRILQRNGFTYSGESVDEEDQIPIWTWTYTKDRVT